MCCVVVTCCHLRSHPPITPVRAATEAELGGGDSWLIYDYVARHFLASLSGNAFPLVELQLSCELWRLYCGIRRCKLITVTVCRTNGTAGFYANVSTTKGLTLLWCVQSKQYMYSSCTLHHAKECWMCTAPCSQQYYMSRCCCCWWR
jgi:hypothetical protein